MRVCPRKWLGLICSAFCCALVFGLSQPTYAEWKATTEFGVTVTPEELWTEVDVSRRFWNRVRHCISSDEFSPCNPALRQQAAQALKAINDELSNRAFQDETIRDLLQFICSRYRTYELLRQIRSDLSNDRLFFQLHATWEDYRYECLQLSDEEKKQVTQTILDEFAKKLEAANLETEKHKKAMDQWKRLNDCVERMYALEAGQALIRQREQCCGKSPELDVLMCKIVRAANRAMIIHPTRKDPPSVEDFLKAWKSCAALESQADKDIWRTVK